MRELLEEFFTHYLRERDLEATLALLTDNIISIGTGEQEIAKNKEELRALTEIEFKELPEPLDFELSKLYRDTLRRLWVERICKCPCQDQYGRHNSRTVYPFHLCLYQRRWEVEDRITAYVYSYKRAGRTGIFSSPLQQEKQHPEDFFRNRGTADETGF